MDNDSSSLINNPSTKPAIIIIPDSEPSNSNNNINDNNNIMNPHIIIRTNKKRSRHEFCLDNIQEQLNDNNNHSTISSSFPKFKGVVPQQNGNWGAQIYANHQRIWLGTFKTASLAAMAYDSAAIKLRTGDLHRNFPWTGLTLQEPQFQAHYSAETILTMIKDGSYQSKFEHFVRARSMTRSKEVANDSNINNNSIVNDNNALDHHYHHHHHHRARVSSDYNSNNNNNNNPRFVTKLLFQKELTPSDVGKLNRLVIPKKYAVKYFPYISEDNFVIDSDDVELVFYDKEMTPWRFRYCYWKSSQSYVFTRGWNRFVKDNKLKANDVVTFYSRDECNSSQSICLIDVTHTNNNTNNNNNNVNSNINVIEGKRGLGLSLDNNVQIRKGFRLFGVEIK